MPGQPVNILLAEDNEDDILMITRAFQRAKLVNIMTVVKDGQEALAFLRQEGSYQRAAPAGLVLLDINMPKTNGLEALAEIKRDPKLRHLPVVILTTSEREEDVLSAYATGACSYITKPVGFSRFHEVVSSFELYWTLVTRIPGPRP